jgi:hypothetical protein
MEHDGTRLYVGGNTGSTSGFPVYNPDLPDTYFQTTNGGGIDGFAAVFNAILAQSWATLYGGSGADWVTGITLDEDTPPNIYVVGYTNSEVGASGDDLCTAPTTSGAFPLCDPGKDAFFEDELNQGSLDPLYNDGFVARFSGSYQMLWGTYFGGNYEDKIRDIDFFTPLGDQSSFFGEFPFEYIIVCGESYSVDLPITEQSLQNHVPEFLMLRSPLGDGTLSEGFQQMFLSYGKDTYGTTFVEPGINGVEEQINAIHAHDGTQMYVAGGVSTVESADIYYHGFMPFFPYQYTEYSITGQSDAYMARFGYTYSIMGEMNGIDDYNTINSCIHAYPNPSSGTVTVQLDCGIMGVEHITLSSISGQVVFNQAIPNTQRNSRTSIDLSGLANGMYLLNIALTDGSIQTLKLIRHDF